MVIDDLKSKIVSFKGAAYRNIYTVSPSQSLFDDLLDEDDFPVAQAWDIETAQIPKGSKTSRPIEYGNKHDSLFVFKKINPGQTRFSDGTFGVWYGAIEEQTSLVETYFWLFKEVQPDLKSAKNGRIRKHRRMFLADLDHDRAINLTMFHKEFPDLTNPINYEFCNRLGKFACENKVGMFSSPSAREHKGNCVPVFDPDAIKSDAFQYDYYLTFEAESKTILIERKGVLNTFSVPKDWTKDT